MTEVKETRIIHECDEMGPKELRFAKPMGSYGQAITNIEYHEGGGWVANNDEYLTVIFFCPFCGIELDKLDKKTKPKAVII